MHKHQATECKVETFEWKNSSWMIFLKELSIKTKYLNENKILNINKQELNFATHWQSYAYVRA